MPEKSDSPQPEIKFRQSVPREGVYNKTSN